MNEKAKESGLTSLERVKAVHITREAFTIENGMMTPTYKLKRNVVYKRYQGEIQKMYEAMK